MAAAFGASIVRAPTLVHGEASEVTHDGAGLLEGMPPAFMAARYHSLCVDPATLPPELRVTAMSEVDRVVMGIRHVALPLEGVQFHPESVLTPEGPHLLANFLRQAGEGEASRLDAATARSRRPGWPRTAPASGRVAAMSDQVRAALATIVEGGTLSLDEARGAMGAVMDGEATPAQLAALLMGLRMRGETVEELAGFAAAMRERVVRVEAPDGAIDVVGTGGDGSGTFNISTTAALVVGRGRRAGRQARQPRDHLAGGLGGRPRGARDPDRPRRGVGRRRRCASSASRSCSRRTSIRRCGTPARPGARSASGPRSTCSGR